ncbi:MAG: hypothetical protein QM791_06420 [Ferruginibacter sp.]
MHRITRFCYRKIIDSSSSKAWERLVFEDSYAEFRLQAQRFNPGNKYSSFAEIIAADPAAEQLHFLVSNTAAAYARQLNGKIPDVLNTLGKHFMPFTNFRFELIHSDTRDISRHTIAINFYSDPVHWIDSIGNTLLLHIPGNKEKNELLTETYILQPFVSIYSVQQND